MISGSFAERDLQLGARQLLEAAAVFTRVYKKLPRAIRTGLLQDGHSCPRAVLVPKNVLFPA